MSKQKGTYQNYFQKVIEAKKAALAEYEMRKVEYIQKQSKLLYEASTERENTPFGGGFTVKDMEKSYGISPWLYRCISVIAWNLSPVKKVIMDENGETIEDYPLLKVLNSYPNPHSGEFDFREQMFSYLDMTGDAFCEIVEKIPGDNNPENIIGFSPMHPDKVKIIPDAKEFIAGYEYKIDNDTIKLEARDVIHIKYFNPYDQYWGLSPMSAAKLAIETDMYSASWNRDFFKDGAVPSAYIEIAGKLDPPERNRLIESWEKKHRGTKQRRIGVIDGGAKLNQLGSSQTDMEFLDQRRFSRSEIMAVYGVPPTMLGVFDFSNTSARSAGAEQQQRTFWEETLLPRLTKFDSAFTKAFRDRGIEIQIKSDLKPIKALQRNLKEMAEIAKIALGAGLTLNEVRTRIWEEDPVEDEVGDVIFLPSNLLPGAQNIEEEVAQYIEDSNREKIVEFPKNIQEHLDRYKVLAGR